MNNLPTFLEHNQVTEEGTYYVSDSPFWQEYWPMVEVYTRGGLLRMIHPEKGIEVAVKGMKGWYFRRFLP